MSMTPARDLGYFRQTEALFNVFRENETGQLLSMHSSNLKTVNRLYKELRCHGYNSVKEFLSSTKLNSEAGADSEAMSPSRFQERLNESSSKWFRQIDPNIGNENYERRRPRTGVTTVKRKPTILMSENFKD